MIEDVDLNVKLLKEYYISFEEDSYELEFVCKESIVVQEKVLGFIWDIFERGQLLLELIIFKSIKFKSRRRLLFLVGEMKLEFIEISRVIIVSDIVIEELKNVR